MLLPCCITRSTCEPLMWWDHLLNLAVVIKVGSSPESMLLKSCTAQLSGCETSLTLSAGSWALISPTFTSNQPVETALFNTLDLDCKATTHSKIYGQQHAQLGSCLQLDPGMQHQGILVSVVLQLQHVTTATYRRFGSMCVSTCCSDRSMTAAALTVNASRPLGSCMS